VQALVLLVEEDRMMRKTISDMLEAMECRVWVNALERARRVMSAIAFESSSLSEFLCGTGVMK